LKKFSLASELTKQVTKWIFIISLPVLIILLIFPEQIINLFWGTEYISGAIALRLLAIGYFFFSLSSISNNILASLGKSKIILYNLFAVSIINLGMNLLLIPNYGIVGAAFATMTSLSLWAILILLEVYYFTKINPFRRKIINVGISAGIFFLFLSYVDLPFIWSILLSLVLYVVLLFLTRAWDKNDNELKRTTFEKIKIFLNNWIIHRQ
jgi:O-antigen/teichoic acid export membrane protein